MTLLPNIDLLSVGLLRLNQRRLYAQMVSEHIPGLRVFHLHVLPLGILLDL